jgi:DNA polymerase (family X)
MPVHNTEIVDALYRLGELLEIEGANPFRVRAYRNAARTISELPESVAGMVASGADLVKLPGIGEDLAGKITELVQTGHLKVLEEEERKLPSGLLEMATLPGLGPKHIKQIHDILKIDSLDGLAKAAEAGKLRDLPRFGAKLEEKILLALRQRTGAPKRMMLARAEEIGEAFSAATRRNRRVPQKNARKLNIHSLGIKRRLSRTSRKSFPRTDLAARKTRREIFRLNRKHRPSVHWRGFIKRWIA